MNKNKSKTSTSTANDKKWLIVGTSVLGATTIAFASLLSCASGGGSYKPGTEVQVQTAVSDPTGGEYKVTFGSGEEKAVVGQKYHGTITLAPKNEDTQECYLPDKLVSVISNTTILKEENYTYTLDAATRKTATLDISADYVFGPIVINLTLVTPSEPGPGPEPEPIVWEDSTLEEVLEIRNDVQVEHLGVNPFVFLSQLEGEGSQYKITFGEYMTSPREDSTEETVYEIDTEAFYIKQTKTTIGETTATDFEYISCREEDDEDAPYYVYRSYNSQDGSKGSDRLYKTPTYALALSCFNPEAPSYAGEYVDDIYGSNYYIYDAYDKEEDRLIEETISGYMEEFEDFQLTPEMTYQKGNSTSFKITNDITGPGEDDTIVNGHFEFIIENGLLVHYISDMTTETENEILVQMKSEFKVERTEFTPDPLDPYFPE